MPPGVARPSIPPYLYPDEDHSPMALAAMELYDALLTQFGLFQFTNPLITVPAHHPAAPAAGHISFWYLIVHAQFATDTQVGLVRVRVRVRVRVTNPNAGDPSLCALPATELGLGSVCSPTHYSQLPLSLTLTPNPLIH